ncbi:MAG: hypothetical protein ETSY1_39570 [Candidatus Entotheonella factor]|uniref:CobW C-terminal domain-containing protein n=1 Tax=Entotheonella factor TaxID=1429438 RepID=W4L5P3_ENTF1|nr:GTP-binding protein [Candidatus Entotheonella palauensis]ETW93357.1 MAG: hypothetical protein ETSY1_39570 [Candidatus Entotheonella factor]
MNMTQDASSVPTQVPVTLICGFLGSGKTSLVNVILNAQLGQRIVVVVNEFGEVDIDSRLVLHADDSVIALRNGCICCTVRSDLNSTLHQLLIRRRQTVDALAFKRILIEASGLASPGPTVQSILADPFLSSQLLWEAGVTLVHAQHIVRQLHEYPEVSEQMAYADQIVLNHCDRCSSEDLEGAESAVRSCNPHAAIHRTSHAQVDVPSLLTARTWDTIWGLDREAVRPRDAVITAAHTHGVDSLSLYSAHPVDLDRLQVWLRSIIDDPSIDMMRIKGLVRCPQHAEAVMVQGVYQWFDMRLADGCGPQDSILVVIGRGFNREAIRQSWANCQIPYEG